MTETKGKYEKVPLLASLQPTTPKKHRKTSSSQRVSSSTNLNLQNRKLQVNDFDHADSWGMLHESDTDYDLERGNTLPAFIDHRPSLTGNNTSTSKKLSLAKTPNKGSKSKAVKQKRSKSKSKKSKPRSKTGSIVNGSRNNNADVVIDVDALLQHVQNSSNNRVTTSSNASGKSRTSVESRTSSNLSSYSTSDHYDEDEDEYNSRPSSKNSSSNSSLDDVCLVLDDEESNESKVWPDISVLEEFSKEETERLRKQAVEDAAAFRFHYDTEEEDINSTPIGNYSSIPRKNNQDASNPKDSILFSHPIVTNIDVPELGNKQVNETDELVKGRLRPKKIAPWHLIQRPASVNQNIKNGRTKMEREMHDNLLVGRNIKYPPHIISNNPEHFRFTYFRIDLDSTIHSPTISGLLQPGQKFQDLFVSSVYGCQQSCQGQSIHQTVNQDNHDDIPTRLQSISPLDNTATGIGAGTNSLNHIQNFLSKNTSTLSTNMGSNGVEEVSPFWLDVVNPTEEEMKVLSKAFGIHPLTTEDIFLGEVREKVELFKDYYLICFRSFDIVAEKHTRKKKENISDSSENLESSTTANDNNNYGWFKNVFHRLRRRRSSVFSSNGSISAIDNSSQRKRRLSILKKREEKERFKRKSGDRHKPREGELEPLNVYIIVFRTGVLTFHFAPTPHPINVRRRARLLRDYLNVTSDWIAYALIDDITDAFGPMIELIEDEVYDIEDSILNMHHNGDSSDSESSSDGSDSEKSDSEDSDYAFEGRSRHTNFSRMTASSHSSNTMSMSSSSTSSRSTGISTFNANLIGWKKKGDMLRRIGECRKRVMSILRLLGAKADVIKGFAKRYNGQWDIAPQAEIGMYLDDIQDHIITMVSSLNHYEKLLSRSHSNYLAQINIDMTKVNNDMNDVLGKITILGTIVLPMNVVTGLWGMNVLVPGQENESLRWFMGILFGMLIMAYIAYVYTKKRFGF